MTQHHEGTLDLSSALGGSQAAKRAVASEIGDRLERVGGMMITGHGISTSLIAETRDAFRAFFGQPAEYKTHFARPATEAVARGYVCRSDVRETDPGMERFSMGEFTPPNEDPYYSSPQGQAYFPPNQLPDRPAEFSKLCGTYFDEIQQLSKRMFDLFEVALATPPGYFTSRLRRSTGNLTGILYPAKENEPDGAFRIQPHTDSGALTILNTEQVPGGGLQFMNLDNEWADVQPSVTDFVINVGDLLHRWSNGVWPSTVHRVLNPSSGYAHTSRLSVVYFEHPDYDVSLSSFVRPGDECVFEPVVVGEFEYDKRLKIHLIDDAGISKMLYAPIELREEQH
ncbi:MAG: hypothetical protein CL908_12020 [Deltaproteobacteria bacterium]|nr:hypothetical protein [Deltaproteobacteria bacterium]